VYDGEKSGITNRRTLEGSLPEMRLSRRFSAPNGSWLTRASQGSSQAENCWEKTVRSNDSCPPPHRSLHALKVKATASLGSLTGFPSKSVPPSVALLSLKSIKHWVKLVEVATEAKKRAKKARYRIPLGRGMLWGLGGGGTGYKERKGHPAAGFVPTPSCCGSELNDGVNTA